MKKTLALSAIVLGISVTAVLGHNDAAAACPFARNSGTLDLQNNPNSPLPFAIKKTHSDMMFGIAATVGLLTTGWVVARRLNHFSPVSSPIVQNEFEDSLAIPVAEQV
ncbi:hypothetical protein C7H19_19205 [Aphanothece hegewaldii CCALA 016]|uniref:Cobalt transporter n=1 Tax=Aphanothece hegewaldii CCALA 016 TaxID=2107694 RepID=A0A2T1LTM8_9CHRO|nr:hypothetical protein [Aphanothece hegewaldii]PSF34259.1 hypothetical protein C7H19_19205 [Aphanothece hegewaldii CCALA 016]